MKNDWIAALAETKVPDRVPDGWKSFQEIRAIFGCSSSILKDRLHVLVASGKAERRMFRAIDAAGRLLPMPRWKLKK